MSYFVIIRGPLGVGKSAVARELARILNGEYVSIDGILGKNGLDKVDEKEWGIPSKNFIKGNEIILPKIIEKLSEGKVVIIDGCFYHKEQIEHFIQHLPALHYEITLKAPLKVCIERDHNRSNGYGEGAATAVHNMVSKFDYGIIINTENQTLDETVKEVLSYLPKPE